MGKVCRLPVSPENNVRPIIRGFLLVSLRRPQTVQGMRYNSFDVDAILSVPLTDPREKQHFSPNPSPALFTWDYLSSRENLARLYEKAKTGQWNSSEVLPWHLDVDMDKVARQDREILGEGFDPSYYRGTVVEHWQDKEWQEFAVHSRKWILSQFLHGEQGALLCTSKIVETVPWYDAKMYASTQVMDEARHVEVFAKYLGDKLGGGYPVNPHLRILLDDVLLDSRWDLTYLGMQIMVEGLALAAFGYLRQSTREPLLKDLLKYVMSDEARHVAFGVLSLREAYEGMSDAEMKDRQEFAYDASIRMRDRFIQQEVWERMGVRSRDIVPLTFRDPTRKVFQQMLFAKIVPNCKKLGLLDRNDAWLRHRFEEMGVIDFEHMPSGDQDYSSLQVV